MNLQLYFFEYDLHSPNHNHLLSRMDLPHLNQLYRNLHKYHSIDLLSGFFFPRFILILWCKYPPLSHNLPLSYICLHLLLLSHFHLASSDGPLISLHRLFFIKQLFSLLSKELFVNFVHVEASTLVFEIVRTLY